MKIVSVIIMRVTQVVDELRINGFKSSLHNMVHFRRKATVIEKDLQGITFDNETLTKNGITFFEINAMNSKEMRLRFKFRNRRLKAEHYLKKGYSGHCLMKDDKIIGDIWYFAQKGEEKNELHRDIKLLKIAWDNAYAYSFDTFLDPNYRGNNIGKALLNNSLYLIAGQGFLKVYGYYWLDNLPAIWNAKVVNKFREVGTVSISRFFFLRISHKERVSHGKGKNQGIYPK